MKKIIHPWQALLLLLILVIAASCQKQGPAAPSKKEKEFALSGFTKIMAGENFTVNLVRSNDFTIRATGAADDLEDLGLSVNEKGQLSIKYKQFKLNRDRISFTISLPSIETLQLGAGARGSVAGFQDQQSLMSAVLTGISSASISGTGMHLDINVSGNAELSLSGIAEELKGMVFGSGQLNAYGLNVKDANVTAGENAKVYISSSNVLFANVTGNGRIYYRGDPSMYLEIYENGKVIRE